MSQEIIAKSGSALGLASLGYGRLPSALRFAPDGDGNGGAAEGGSGDGGAGGSGAGKGEGGKGDGGEGADENTPIYTKAQHDALLNETKKEREARRKLEADLKELRKNALTPEEITEFRNFRVEKQKAEEAKVKEKGEYEKLIQKQEAEHKAALEAAAKERDDYKSKFHAERFGRLLASEIPKHTTAPVEDLSPLIMPYLQIDEEDGSIVVLVNGVTPKNEKGQDMSPAEFIAAEIARRPHFAVLKPANGSGGGNQNGKGKGGKPTFTREEIASMSEADFKKNEAAILAQGAVA